MGNICEICGIEGTEEIPVRYFYDLGAIVCSLCIEEHFEFAEGKEQNDD